MLMIAGTVYASSEYEVWAGNQNFMEESKWWDYFYNIHQHGYTKLGAATSTRVFEGEYQYYVVVARKKAGVRLERVNTLAGLPMQSIADGNLERVSGAPYSILGINKSGGYYGSFIVYRNAVKSSGAEVVVNSDPPRSLKRTWEVYELAVKSTEVDQSRTYARLSTESERNLLVVNAEENFAVLIGLEKMDPWAMEAEVEIVRFPAAAPRQGAMGITTAERNIFSLRLETDGFGEALLLGTETVSRKAAKDGSVAERRSVSLRGVGIDYDPEDDFGPEYEYSVNSARYNQAVSDQMNRSGDPLQLLYQYVAGKTGLKNDLDEVIDSIGWAFEQ